jgi:hypothetical protein
VLFLVRFPQSQTRAALRARKDGRTGLHLIGQVRRASLENSGQRGEFLAKSLGRLKCSTQMGESILKSCGGLESRGELAQTFAERHTELAEFLVERFQRRELFQHLLKLVLEVVHRLEHFSQVPDLSLELAQRFEHACKLRELLYRFEDNRDLRQLLLERSDLIEDRRYRQTGLK